MGQALGRKGVSQQDGAKPICESSDALGSQDLLRVPVHEMRVMSRSTVLIVMLGDLERDPTPTRDRFRPGVGGSVVYGSSPPLLTVTTAWPDTS